MFQSLKSRNTISTKATSLSIFNGRRLDPSPWVDESQGHMIRGAFQMRDIIVVMSGKENTPELISFVPHWDNSEIHILHDSSKCRSRTES